MIKENIIYLISKGVSGIVSLLALSLISHTWPDTIYGQYSLIIANSNIIIVGFFYCVRIYYTRYSRKNNEQVNFKNIDSIINTIFLIALIICLLLTPYDPSFTISLIIALAQIKFELFQEKQRIEFLSVQFLKSAILKSVLYVGMITLFSYINYTNKYGLIISYLISFIGIIIINRKNFSFEFSKDYELVKKAIDFGFPFMFTPISSTILFSYYRYCIQNFSGTAELGGFSYVNDLCEFTIIAAMMAVNLSGYPKLIKYYENKDWTSFFKQSEFNFSMQCCIYLGLIIGSSLILPHIIGTFVSNQYSPYINNLFYYILLGSFLKGLKVYYLDHFLLVMADRKINIICTCTYLMISLFVIPVFLNKYQLIGAAYAFIFLNLFYLILTAALVTIKYQLSAFNIASCTAIALLILNIFLLGNSLLLNIALSIYFIFSVYYLTKNENSNLLARLK